MNILKIEKNNFRRCKQLLESFKSGTKVFYDKRILYMFNLIANNDLHFLNLIKNTFSGFFDTDFRFGHYNDCVFFIFSDIDWVKIIISSIQQSNTKPNITLCIMPRLNETLSAYLLEDDQYSFPDAEINLFGELISLDNERKTLFSIKSINLDFIPIEKDLLTLYSFNFIPRCWSFKDLTVITELNTSLESLKLNCNGFSSVISLGSISSLLFPPLTDINLFSKNQLILIDRTIDLVTPLLTQSNYEGMIAENLGINCGIVTLINSSKKESNYCLIETEDPLINELRLLNFIEFDSTIKSMFINVQERLKKREINTFDLNSITNSAKEDQTFVLKYKTLNSHLEIQEQLSNSIRHNRWRKQLISMEAQIVSGQKSPKDLIHEMVLAGANFQDVIKLLCLNYVVNGKSEDYEKYVQVIYSNYGFQQLPFLMRLQNIGLYNPNPINKTLFKELLDPFKLISDDWVEKNDEAASLYLGYVPLTVRIIEKICKGESQIVLNSLQKNNIKIDQIGKFNISNDSNVFICFVGGCTHSEINLLRRISKKLKVNFYILTTRIFTTNEFFEDISFGIPNWYKVSQP